VFLIGWLVGFLLSLAFWALSMANVVGFFAVIYWVFISPLFHTGWSWKFILYGLEWFIAYHYMRGLGMMRWTTLEMKYRGEIVRSLVGGVAGLYLYYWMYHHRSAIPWTLLWLVPVTTALNAQSLSGLSMVLLEKYEGGEPPPSFRGVYEEFPPYRLWRGFMKPVLGFARLYDNRFKKKQQPDTSLGAAREGTLTDAEKAGLL
jgi:hypothetical protein